MLRGIIGFEIRYQLRNPVFWVAIAIFGLMGFGLTASENVSIGTPGGVKENSPFALAVAMSVFSLFYLFIVTAFSANAIVRDEATNFAPIVRSTSVSSRQIVIGRFVGGLVVAWLGYLSVPLGMLLGTTMSWVDPETIGPQNPAYYLWNYALFALPNIFMLSAVLFALATILRSMMAAYIGAIVLFLGYFVTTGALGGQIEYREMLALWDPTGSGALREATRYWTQAELNSRLIDLSGTMLLNRIWAVALGAALLGATLWRYSLTERAPSAWRLRRLARREVREQRLAEAAAATGGEAVVARDLRPSRWAQFTTRLRVEVRQVLTSPGLIVLTLLSMGFTAITLWLIGQTYGTSDHPTVSSTITGVQGGSTLFLLMIAVFYGGELVWRERDRKFNEILDSTPAPSWVMTVPKIVAIFLILFIVNLAAMATGLIYQLVQGARELGLGGYFAWFVIPAAIDGLLIAILAVFAQIVSPNKYIGWGIIFLWFVGSIFLGNMGYSNPLYSYGNGPGAPLSDFNGAGSFWIGGAVFRLYWLSFAVILIVIAHLLWPRGTDLALKARFRKIGERLTPAPLAIAGVAALVMAGTGYHAYRNIKVLNSYVTSDEVEKLTADYERKYLRYENLPRPTVTNVKLDLQLFPRERRLMASGRYDLRNDSGQPIRELHVRQAERDAEFLKIELAGARLASDDKRFQYRIYRFDRPLAPGATTSLTFESRLWRRGFRAGSPNTDVIENGTFVNNAAFAPLIGMSRQGLLTDRTKRRRQKLPAELRMAKLEDLKATRSNYVDADWVMSDITLTTDADQVPIAPGAKVSDRTAGGRRTAHFVSTAPILHFFSVQSANYRIATRDHNGVKLSVYHTDGHDWNVPKMLKAMASSLDYYRSNFGPYQFDYARIIEFPGFTGSFAQAFAGTMPYSESIGFNANTNDPEKIDFTTYVIAHEIAHQYWAHQVIGANMQGGTLTSETLAQYSALMVMKKLYGPDKIRRFLKYELDLYLASRKGEALEEMPIYRVENQQYVHYRKGSVAMYLLQERLGEDAVNRALSRFLARFRFKGAPYLRSVDLIEEFRKEAKSPEQQQLITDLFEKITLYDLKVSEATTRRVGKEWLTTVTIGADKFYASGKGVEAKTKLAEPIEVGLFDKQPGIGPFSAKDVILVGRQPLRNGSQKITLRSSRKPAFAGVDPYNFYVDRNSDDNVRPVTAS